jgi:hypothetical protein
MQTVRTPREPLALLRALLTLGMISGGTYPLSDACWLALPSLVCLSPGSLLPPSQHPSSHLHSSGELPLRRRNIQEHQQTVVNQNFLAPLRFASSQNTSSTRLLHEKLVGQLVAYSASATLESLELHPLYQAAGLAITSIWITCRACSCPILQHAYPSHVISTQGLGPDLLGRIHVQVKAAITTIRQQRAIPGPAPPTPHLLHA